MNKGCGSKKNAVLQGTVILDKVKQTGGINLGVSSLLSTVVLMVSLSVPMALAQDVNSPKMSDDTSKDDVSQFQSWLKNNGQEQQPIAALSSSDSTSPPPAQLMKKSAIPSLLIVPPDETTQSKPLTLKESQQVMLNSTPFAKPPSADATEAFNTMMQQNMPMTPQQVVRLRQLIDVSQRAAAIPANVPPKPVSSTLMVNLAPGTTPPAIRLAQGYVSSLVFVDSTASPWPIASYDAGDPKAATIQWDGKSNILIIQATAPYSESNLVVRLVGLPTPITLELVSGQREVDYRADIHVSGIGPNTKDLPTGTRLPDSANQLLLSVLDGVAPPGSSLLIVKGGSCQAWLLGEKMYLRTRFTVLSPGWVGKMVSSDGMNAYEIQKTSSVLVSQYGEPVELKVEGF